MKFSRILLVGGTGYFGRNLHRYLSENTTSEIFISGRSTLIEKNYYRIVFGEPKTYQVLKDSQFDLVVILASSLKSLATSNLNHPDVSLNTIDYANFLQFLSDERICDKIVYTSSMTVYDSGNNSPVQETDKLSPPNSYGLTKQLAENITSFFCFRNNVSGVILRIPGIYGADKKSGVIYNTIARIKKNERPEINTSGLTYWETIHVDDLCEMFGAFLLSYQWNTLLNTFNMCYGEETDFYSTIRCIAEQLHYDQELIFEKEKGYVKLFLSNDKIRNIIPVKYSYYHKLKQYIDSFKP
jgi:nucleoside-diphosphate-sugar epimerase